MEANIKTATLGVSAGGVFNMATGRAVTLNELLRMLCPLCGMSFAPDYGVGAPGGRLCAIVRQDAQEWLGCRPRLGSIGGLQKLLAGFTTRTVVAP